MTGNALDPWAHLRTRTRARIGLGRSGGALPTAALLDFQLDHARARDAVHGAVDFTALAADLALPAITVQSRAGSRDVYIRRPDLGRQLAEEDDICLRAQAREDGYDLVFVIGDGLSAAAVSRYAPSVVRACFSRLSDFAIGPVVLAHQARVALADDVGAALGARMTVILVGERPGLSVPDSLGAYLTWNPLRGRKDSERNCISNIHEDGLSIEAAADKICWLVREAIRRQITGVDLKDETPLSALSQTASLGQEAHLITDQADPHSRTQVDPWPQRIL